jgi:hypothetical protein
LKEENYWRNIKDVLGAVQTIFPILCGHQFLDIAKKAPAGSSSVMFPNLSTPASKENKDTNLLDIIPN